VASAKGIATTPRPGSIFGEEVLFEERESNPFGVVIQPGPVADRGDRIKPQSPILV